MTQHGGHHGSYDEDEDDVPEWADEVMATVAREVRRRRRQLRMSAQDLADACAEIGHPIPRNVIANMENGRRATLPLVDVLVLAKALRTPPVCLLYPVGYVDEVRRLPYEYPVPALDALHWFTGDTIDDDVLARDSMVERFQTHADDQHAALAALKGEKYERWKAETAASPAQRAAAEQARSDYAERAVLAKYALRQLRKAIREDGGTPPPLPPELADVDPPGSGPDTPEENV